MLTLGVFGWSPHTIKHPGLADQGAEVARRHGLRQDHAAQVGQHHGKVRRVGSGLPWLTEGQRMYVLLGALAFLLAKNQSVTHLKNRPRPCVCLGAGLGRR